MTYIDEVVGGVTWETPRTCRKYIRIGDWPEWHPPMRTALWAAKRAWPTENAAHVFLNQSRSSGEPYPCEVHGWHVGTLHSLTPQ